ncbi:hypothetical protein ABMA28_013822 [Loxostege sticticalis]|uniref:Uncharacterized protein n=1 Tax=Loxostege sticticalis TaxID=481309 RepID=A0ABD0TJN7_LOXSC
MSVQRSPPQGLVISASGSGSGGGSAPDLSTWNDEDPNLNVNMRKRKERSEEYDYRKDWAEFRADIMRYLEGFTKNQTHQLNHICEEIAEIKNEIKTIKSTAESLTLRFEQVNNDIQVLKNNNYETQNKIKNIETEISQIKNQHIDTSPKSLFYTQENLILEVKDRCDREKNVIFVGIPELNNKNANTRKQYDEEQIMKLTTSLYEPSPKPDKPRPIKTCYNNKETPKYLLRNKSKLPESIKIYSDQTPSQKLYLDSLKNELHSRIENGEKNIAIKYIKGVPKIVKDQQKNQ